MTSRLLAAIALATVVIAAAGARAEDCPGRPQALGTSRVLAIDPREFPRLGTMQYSGSLPLRDKEVVLTFDDGPMPPYSNRVLDVLAEHCVKATYFLIGRMARGYPQVVRRMLAEGHTIGTHSENHLLAFDRMPIDAVRREIEAGIASVGAALGNRKAVAPFFRIPGLLRAPAVDKFLQSQQLATWSADLAGDDWKHISASEVVRRVMARLAEKGKGIVLLHDIQPATALALPELLRELKARDYRVVQVVPARAVEPAAVAAATEPSAPHRPGAAPKPATAVAKLDESEAATGQTAEVETAPAKAPPAPDEVTASNRADDDARTARAESISSAPPPTPASGDRSAIESERAAQAQALAAVPRQPAQMPPPSDPRPSARPGAAESADATPAVVQAPARPYAARLKPSQGFAAPAKLSVLRMVAPPNLVTVPVPHAGGVGASALARAHHGDSGRFLPDR